VGADNVGVLIAEEPYNQDEKVLIIDIGTNGELLMATGTRSAPRPAPPGRPLRAPRSSSACARPPAPSRPWRSILRRKNRATRSSARRTGTRTSRRWTPRASAARHHPGRGGDVQGGHHRQVRQVRAGPGHSARAQGHRGQAEYVLAWASETSIGQDITVTQGDVRALQLAKGALYTGAKLMMKRLGITTLDRVILAGAFGSHIDARRP